MPDAAKKWLETATKTKWIIRNGKGGSKTLLTEAVKHVHRLLEENERLETLHIHACDRIERDKWRVEAYKQLEADRSALVAYVRELEKGIEYAVLRFVRIGEKQEEAHVRHAMRGRQALSDELKAEIDAR